MDELNIYDSEIPPKQIFDQMKSNIYDEFYLSKYSSINKAYIYSRKTLFNILHKITNAMGFKSQTFFLCAHYLDIIFSSNKSINININLIGLSSLCLSAKYCENDPIVPHLQYFIKVYNVLMGYKNFLSMNDLKTAEVSVLKLLDYKLNYFTVYDFNSFFFAHGILKLDQIKELGKNKNKNSRKNFYVNQINSLMIKSILEKIYKKSRYYLDIIVNRTRLCFKYNSLYLSILIMKKSVNEILAHEQNIFLADINDQIEVYKKNSICFKEIMSDFYNIEYENNEQYKKLIKDEEIKEIFAEKKNRGVENYPPPPMVVPEEEKKENEKENNYRINKINNYRINKKENNNFNWSASNGFFKKTDINKDNINKKEGERERASRIERNTIYKSREKEKGKDKILDNINIDFNINEFQNSYRKIKTMKNKLNNANKSDINIHNNNQEEKEVKEEKEISISKKRRFIPRLETYNNFNYRSTICNLKSSEKTYNSRKYCLDLNKNKEENNSTIDYGDKSINNNYSNNRFIKIKGLNKGKESKDYSFNITENYNNNNDNEINKKSCEKKLYFKKYIYQSNNIDNYSSLNFNSTNNINLNVSKNKNRMDSNNVEESLNTKRNLIMNKYYTRINLKIPNNEKNLLNTSINLGNDNTFQNNNTININENKKMITSSTRYRRRRLFYNTTVNNKINNNNKEDISGENMKEQEQERNTINAVSLNNNKNEIESYTSKNDNKGLTGLNFYRNSYANKISVNTINKINNNEKDINKSFISGNKNKISYLLGKQNSQLNNTLKEINMAYAKNINEERKNNSQKSKEKEKDKDNEIKSNNDIPDDNNSKDNNIKNSKINYIKSIRQKYLNNNKNNRKNKSNINSLNNNENILEEKSNINKDEYNTIKNRYSSRNKKTEAKIKYNYNEKEENNIYNDKKIVEKEKDNCDKSITKYSFYKPINKTKSFYAINENEENKTKNEGEAKTNKTNLSFYKSHNNFFISIKSDKNYEQEQRNKEELIKNQQDKKIGNNNYTSSEFFKRRNIYRKSNIPTPSNLNNNSFINYTKDNNNNNNASLNKK